MKGRSLNLAIITALLLGQSVCFFRQGLAGAERLMGERAYSRNHLLAAWQLYQQALDHGGPSGLLETDLLQVLSFGIDLREVGAKTDLPLDDAAALAEVRRLNARAIRRAPHLAVHWSMASDVFLRQARLDRRRMPLDLSSVSEEPLENLLPQDWWGIAALEKAAALEPGNYLYDDLLTEQFLSYGAVEAAALACRRAVASYPRLDGHPYLMRADLPPQVVDAAVEGFEEALATDSLVAKASMAIDAGHLLARHGREERALPFLERAVRAAPDLFDAHMELAMALFALDRFGEAIPHIEKAIQRLPEEPFPYYYLGKARLETGDLKGAIEDFRRSRILGQGAVRFFHALGSALEADGDLSEAERQFTAAAYYNPTDASAWSALLAYHVRRGNRDAAARDCEKLLELSPEDDRVREQCAALDQEGA